MTAKPVMSVAAAEAALNAATALVTASSTLKIYSGAQPATTLTSEAGTLGGTLTFGATPFGSAATGTSDGNVTATAGAISPETNAPNSITAGHFRIATTGGTVIMQGNCGTSSADLVMSSTTITAGDTVACSSFKEAFQCGDGVS
jgi:hypothetical protein